MKKVKKKRIVILIILILAIIVQIKIFTDSRANKLIEVTANLEDYSGLLEDEKYILQAVNEDESGYCITLPGTINDKIALQYYIEPKQILKEEKSETEEIVEEINKEQEEKSVEETEDETETSVISEDVEGENKESNQDETNHNAEENIEETNTDIENIDENEENIRQPGDKIYLTEEEIEKKEINIIIEYDIKEKDEEVFYNKVIEQQVDEKIIRIEGYMPLDSQIKAELIEEEEINQIALQQGGKNASLKVVYDIKIISKENEYEPTEFDENVQVTITGMGEVDKEKQKYKIVHIKEDNTSEEIEKVETKEDSVTFETNHFSTYAVMVEDVTTENEGIALAAAPAIYAVGYALSNTADVWDGTIATGFKHGQGTQANPYLITKASELAYLAQQVNNGQEYEGIVFQLTNDIDLDGREWTPIGDMENPFKGIFNGSGRVIANATMTIDETIPTNVIYTYGLFGCIGDGNSYSIIRNLQLEDINISFEANGNTNTNTNTAKGYNIGFVTGTMYNRSMITNVSVKNSNITSSGTLRVRSRLFQVFVGGIAGTAQNSNGNVNDPGNGARYAIENCYVSADIDVSSVESYQSSRQYYMAMVHTGGIIGCIRRQTVWPENCLYRGAIEANGFVGPIFGGLIERATNNNNVNYFTAYWNGNQAGGNLTMTSYYTNYSVNGRSFTNTVQSGNSTAYIANTVSNNNINGVKGVNKGIYTNNISTLEDTLNSSGSDVVWIYEDNDLRLIPRLTSSVTQTVVNHYEVSITDRYNIGNYTYQWYKNGELDTSSTGIGYDCEPNFIEDQNILVVISDGTYYNTLEFLVERLYIDIEFNVNRNNASVVATLTGTALPYANLADYTYQWYEEDISGEGGPIEGATSLTLNNLQDGMDYRLVATNAVNSYLSAENSFTFGDRNVIYVNYSGGNNNNDGFTEETAVQNLSTGYARLEAGASRNKNVIVLMGNYNDANVAFLNSMTATTYAKNVTITGKYKGKDYNASLRFGTGSNFYRHLTADLTLQYLTLNGGGTGNSMYFCLQGHDLTIGEGVTMTNYQTANTNQGLLGGRAPAFHLFAGWYQYNYSRLPNNDCEVIIKSGTYGRLVLGGTPGTSSGLNQTTSRNFMGSSMEDSFRVSVTIDIKNSTTAANYDYDVNLLVGGSASGNNYSVVTENIKNGTVGRVLGGSIGDASSRPNNWRYPINTFLGETTINVYGGSVDELYGGCLGRNMNVVGSANATGNACDSYFYGTVNINILGGEVNSNIYGAGAGGVTGYHENSSDPYKSYGEDFETAVNINITGGRIEGNVYGGGYGYTEYLNRNVTTDDGGALYGDSNIVIDGNPTIIGNIYAAGCGYNFSNKPELAQMTGTSNIEIKGNPIIEGQIFGAGQGISGYDEMAKLTGNSIVNIETNLDTEVYGGGNISKIIGNPTINIKSGTHTGDIYGGGNLGIVEGTTNVNINDGTNTRVFGGGNQAEVTNSIVTINGGNTTDVYAGGNAASVENTQVYLKGGQTTTIYGGSNQTGTVTKSTIETTGGTAGTIYGGNNIGGTTSDANVIINGGTISTAVYGGGNQVDTTKTTVTLTKADATIPSVFGGGNQAGVPNTYVYCNGANVTNVFGGSNTNGTVNNSHVEVNSGNINNVYGGNNQGGTTQISNVDIKGGTITNVYGGGDQAQSTTSNITTTGGTITNIYGGGNQAGVTTTNVNNNGGTITNTFGGSNRSGNVTTSNVTTSNGNIQYVYGGNNQGGVTQTTNITINGGQIGKVYGGGNQAISGETNVQINAEVQQNVFGGGRQAGVNTDTNVNLTGATVGDNVYGGGDEGIVSGDTFVRVKNSTLLNSLYAGGNGTTAVVHGNTNLIMEGTTNNVTNNVFGGGNKAETGTEANNNSTSTVNIVGGTIGKNVYGGANTSVVYGETQTNIGYDTINDSSLEKGNIYIGGTVFGGGEANEAGSEIYDFTFISVTKGIDIQINGNGHTKLEIKGSIFGSGNASSTSGESYINIQNYGTADSPQSNVSLQRANCATISNSAISLSGATDRTNEYSGTFFSISRVDKVKLKNNSILYLCNGANLLTELESLVDQNGQEIKGVVTINPETGETTRNVDNRIYMLEGKNLNVATNQQATAYGKVQGMFFFGLFANKNNPALSTGLYHQSYDNGETITNAGTFISNSYVKAQHMVDHDTTIDGFYTNYNEEGKIKANYIETTPKDDVYYIWLVGEKMDVTVFDNIELLASKFATLGTYELALEGFSDPNIKFSLMGFSSGLINGISLVNPNEIQAIEPDEERANSVYGLAMKTGNMGWTRTGTTTFFTESGGTYTGTTDYASDNSTFTPKLNFHFYHSQNITKKQALGDLTIRLQAATPIDDLNDKISYIDIILTLSSVLIQEDYYEGAITPGQEYGLFTTTETTITNKSVFSTYYSLFINKFSENKYYEGYKTYKRTLVSRDSSGLPYVLPKDTKLTLLDMATDKYYYYIITADDVTNNRYEYYLEDFIAMGSNDDVFDEVAACDEYYMDDLDLIYENLICHINFADANITENIYDNTLLIELRDTEDEALITVWGNSRDVMTYTVYCDKDATIEVTGNINPDTLYLGHTMNLNVITNFTQSVVDSKTVYDTHYFDQKLGIKISIYDSEGNRLNNDSLLGVNFELDGKLYYPRIDGTTRINISDKVTDVLARIKMNTQDNTTWATGDYKVKIESFGSPDGIYYGLVASDEIEFDLRVINSSYGLKVTTGDLYKFVNKDTGETKNGNNVLISTIEYSSALTNPSIVVALYRRDYSEVFSQEYTLVDLKDYVKDVLLETPREKEYMVTTSPSSEINYRLLLNTELMTGTYKLVYKLYDDDTCVGEAYDYMIIK